MRRLTLIAILAALVVTASATTASSTNAQRSAPAANAQRAALVAGTHKSDWAFKKRAVRQKAVALRLAFNRHLPNFGPHEVRCRGKQPVRLRRRGKGFTHIRCVVRTLAIKDYIYHLNRRGRTVLTRRW